MPHQCLNCGNVIERGSDEILKGCTQCGGKKFIYTSQPMSQERRENLKKRADSVRDKMIKKADPELLKILREKGMTDIDGSKLEMDESLGEDWVRYSPSDEDEKIEIEPGISETSTEIVTSEKGRKKSARDLIEEYDRKKKVLEEKVEPSDEIRKKRKVAKKKRKTEKPSTKKPPAAVAPAKKQKGDVEVINILEQGVYEIDVEKLLEDNPIIIEKDGTYLLHLPTLFKEKEKRK